MATVTAYTAARMKAIEDASVVAGEIVDGHLILQRFDATLIDAGPIESAVTRDTSAALAAANDIYPVGRVIEATDSYPKSFKIADSVTHFNSLPWYRASIDPIRNEYDLALVSAGNPVNGVLTNLTSLGSLTFTVGSVPMRAAAKLTNWFGSLAADYFSFCLCLSNGTILQSDLSSPNQNNKYQGSIKLEHIFVTPGTYTIKVMYARIVGSGTITISNGGGVGTHFLEVVPYPGI